MKVRLVEKFLKESVPKSELEKILHLISEAHDRIMEAQDNLNSLSYEYEDEIIDNLSYDLDDIEATLSEIDFIGYEDPVNSCLDYYRIEDDEEE